MASTRHKKISTVLFLVTLSATAHAQKLRFKDKPRNDPSQCPYCLGEEELMRASGVLSHGGFEFAMKDTAGVDEFLPTSDIRWVETAHFELGMAMGPMKVGQKDKKKVRAELERLATMLPDTVSTKSKILDPWLRAHLYALRVEDIYAQMQSILQVDDSMFPDGKSKWKMDTKYMGEGPHLGQIGKYEVLLLQSEGSSSDFLQEEFGLVVKRSQRFNVIPRDTLILVAHTQQDGLRNDGAMHGHVAFNLAHMCLDGYKHYSYDIPVWIREGVAHWVERSISPLFNSFDASEGSGGAMTRKTDWGPPVRKLASSDDSPGMARLMRMRSFAEFTLDTHYVTWSMIDFLLAEHPDFLATLLDRIKGLTNAQGLPDPGRLEDVHRDAFKEVLGLDYRAFDQAWAEWVLAQS